MIHDTHELVQKRHHHSPARVSPIQLHACGPSLRSKQLRHFNKGKALCNSGGMADIGILYRLAPFGPRGAVARKRRDVETSQRAPGVVPSLQTLLVRQSGLSKQWDALPSLLCDLSLQRSHAELGATSPCMPGSSDPCLCSDHGDLAEPQQQRNKHDVD